MNNLSLNLESVPKELLFILDLVKDTENGSMSIQKERIDEINWDLFIELSMHHRLYPILHSKLKQLGEMVPSYVRKPLYNLYQRNTFQMLHLTAEMENVNKQFDGKEIPILFLKGPMLAQELYGELSMRTCSDIDFLIPIQDLEKAECLLEELGYEKDDYIKTILNDWRWRHHHVTYFHPQKGLKLEIHWRLHPGPGKEPVFEELWERKAVSNLTKTPIFFLGKEDLFIFLTAHGARHGWSRLRWLVDIHQLLQQPIDWRKVLFLSRKYHCREALIQSIVLSKELLNSKLSDQLQTILLGTQPKKLAQRAIYYLENMVNLHTDPVPQEVSRYHERYLFSLMPIKQKIIFMLSFLFPYPEDAETLPLPKKLHFLYFPLRPFLWGWRKTRRKHALP
ncbi:hypothetical protein J2S74_004015 [Evansella vedderi]|uniref:Renal dipeptidase n=1 Tax=Evansella vedderi TaxID=38282 RepID=A0ABT9ZZC0_9BACI|nr:hypothetical protein [Evansella vedderi]